MKKEVGSGVGSGSGSISQRYRSAPKCHGSQHWSLDIILRVLALEVFVYNIYTYKPVLNHFCSRGRGESKTR